MSAVLTVILLSLAVGASIIVFYVFPSSTASLLRYKLWALRDELVDGLNNDEFQDVTQPRKLVRDVELTIESAEELRPVRMLVLMLLAGGKRPPGNYTAFDLSRADDADKLLLEPLWRRYVSAVIKHVLFGSWSGFVVAPILIFAAAIESILKGRIGRDGGADDGSVVDDMKQVVRREIHVEPTLRVLAERRTPKSLSASV
jgi:hypothetical protein